MSVSGDADSDTDFRNALRRSRCRRRRRDNADVRRVLFVRRRKFGHQFRVLGGDVRRLARIGREIEELPVADAVWRLDPQRFPVAAEYGALAAVFEGEGFVFGARGLDLAAQ